MQNALGELEGAAEALDGTLAGAPPAQGSLSAGRAAEIDAILLKVEQEGGCAYDLYWGPTTGQVENSANQGKESSNYLQGCMICAFCP